MKKAPHRCGALTKTKPNGGNSLTSDINDSTVELLSNRKASSKTLQSKGTVAVQYAFW
jgi:hypothetical protein